MQAQLYDNVSPAIPRKIRRLNRAAGGNANWRSLPVANTFGQDPVLQPLPSHVNGVKHFIARQLRARRPSA